MYTRASFLENTKGSETLFAELLKTMRNFIESYDNLGFLEEGVDKDWAALYLFFDFIGPAIVEPMSQPVIGKSMYSDDMISARNSFMRRLFTSGIYKIDTE